MTTPRAIVIEDDLFIKQVYEVMFRKGWKIKNFNCSDPLKEITNYLQEDLPTGSFLIVRANEEDDISIGRLKKIISLGLSVPILVTCSEFSLDGLRELSKEKNIHFMFEPMSMNDLALRIEILMQMTNDPKFEIFKSGWVSPR